MHTSDIHSITWPHYSTTIPALSPGLIFCVRKKRMGAWKIWPGICCRDSCAHALARNVTGKCTTEVNRLPHCLARVLHTTTGTNMPTWGLHKHAESEEGGHVIDWSRGVNIYGSFQYIFIWTSLNTVFSDVIRSSSKWYSSINRSSEADLNNVSCPIQPVYTLSSMSC